ncbi:transient receptor potential channel pyrexia isoform X2 [Condylostylus longicornis]|uniref:transient receptor potential channel pyrexia isoform X2 n=1 Tax=Condylostylus longicornis TaxID=2530218 RepID=UPI00244DA501|nr:transient receptor potential channel pyrexia isoform X2 [Condylostylus longicornis]
MAEYKKINQELAVRNSDLRLTIAELNREIVFLNEIIVQLKSENASIKDSVKKILANSYCKILTEVCGMPNVIVKNNTAFSSNFMSPNQNASNSQNNEESCAGSSKSNGNVAETSNADNSPSKNVTRSRRGRTKPQNCLLLPQENENNLNNPKTIRNDYEIENLKFNGIEKDETRRHLQTIIEEENSARSSYSNTAKLENDNTLTQLNTIVSKTNQTCSYGENSYLNNTKEMSSLLFHKTFSDTTLNLLLNAPSSTPFKKRKTPRDDKIFCKIPVVKVRRLHKKDLMPLMIPKKRIPSTKLLKGKVTVNTSKESINLTDKAIKSENNGESLKDDIHLRPRRRAAPTCFKEITLKTKMRYDPKKEIYNGGDITSRTNGGITALSFIVRRTPDIIPKFIAKLDSSIKVNDHEIGDVDCEIKLDFRQLVPNTERGESELIMSFIEVGQKRILTHPLCETFLFLKWRRIRKFFLMSLFYHAAYVLLFSLYVTGVYVKSCLDDASCRPSSYSSVVGYFVVVLNLALTGREFFEMGHGIYAYAKYWENWLQWTIILGVFLCVTPDTIIARDLEKVPKWQFHIAAIIIFLVWLELMMLVGRFPIFGLYIQMFTKVAVNFGKFLLAYCCLLIAFALSFSVLFSRYKAFKSIPWSFLKVVTMMAGELEFEDIFYGEEEDTKSGDASSDLLQADTEIISFPVTSHIIFLAFVLLVTVILTNLVVGLAVSDIQGLQVSAGLDRLIRQAELVSRLEGLFFSRLLRKTPPKLLSLCQRSALLRTSRYQLQFMTRPNDPRDTQLPEDIKLNIFKLVADRRDRNQTIRRRRCEDNFDTFQRSVGRYDYSMGINCSKEDTCALRPRSIAFSRQRLFSDNEKGMNKIKLTAKNSIFDSTESDELKDIKTQLRDMKAKFDKFTEILSKKMNVTAEELCRIKMQLDQRSQH